MSLPVLFLAHGQKKITSATGYHTARAALNIAPLLQHLTEDGTVPYDFSIKTNPQIRAWRHDPMDPDFVRLIKQLKLARCCKYRELKAMLMKNKAARVAEHSGFADASIDVSEPDKTGEVDSHASSQRHIHKEQQLTKQTIWTYDPMDIDDVAADESPMATTHGDPAEEWVTAQWGDEIGQLLLPTIMPAVCPANLNGGECKDRCCRFKYHVCVAFLRGDCTKARVHTDAWQLQEHVGAATTIRARAE
ncbi:hypothetical protein NX059_011099 [Plenodomus lindquistii]|nr:hypothetical protein NX059_011099 [Plenodomus lindquistii]